MLRLSSLPHLNHLVIHVAEVLLLEPKQFIQNLQISPHHHLKLLNVGSVQLPDLIDGFAGLKVVVYFNAKEIYYFIDKLTILLLLWDSQFRWFGELQTGESILFVDEVLFLTVMLIQNHQTIMILYEVLPFHLPFFQVDL